MPKEFTVTYSPLKGPEETKTVKVDWEGGGWLFQADEVARRIRDSKLQSADWGWDKNALEMEIFDEVSVLLYVFLSPLRSGVTVMALNRICSRISINRFGDRVDTYFPQV